MITQYRHIPARIAFIAGIVSFVCYLDSQHSATGQAKILTSWIDACESLKQTRERLRTLVRLREEEIRKLTDALQKKKSELANLQRSIGQYDAAITKIEQARLQ